MDDKLRTLLARLRDVLDRSFFIQYDEDTESFECLFCGPIGTDWIHAKDCEWAALEKAYEEVVYGDNPLPDKHLTDSR